MSTAPEASIPAFLPAPRTELERVQWWALVVGAIAVAVCVLGVFVNTTAFLRAYLAAYLFFLGIGHGSLVILMVYYLTGGAWGYLIRKPLEAGMRTMPL